MWLTTAAQRAALSEPAIAPNLSSAGRGIDKHRRFGRCLVAGIVTACVVAISELQEMFGDSGSINEIVRELSEVLRKT